MEILRVGGLLLQLLCSRQARKKMQQELLRKNKLRQLLRMHKKNRLLNFKVRYKYSMAVSRTM